MMDQLLQALQSGDVTPGVLEGFSDLSSDDTAQVWEIWVGLPVEVRRKVIRMLGEIAEQNFEFNFCQVFRLALEDEDAEVRLAAVEGLWEDEDVRLIPLLIDRLADSSTGVRAAAAVSLGRFLLLGELQKIRPQAHEKVFRALMGIFEVPQEEMEVRRRALESLAYSSEEVVGDLISDTYRDPNRQMRASAVFAMGRSADERWATAVLQELGSIDPEMRYEAARACGELAVKKALPMLIELVLDVDTEVQEAAIWALGQIGGDEARQALMNCAAQENEALRMAAQEALRELEFLHGDLGALLLWDFVGESDDEEEEEEM